MRLDESRAHSRPKIRVEIETRCNQPMTPIYLVRTFDLASIQHVQPGRTGCFPTRRFEVRPMRARRFGSPVPRVSTWLRPWPRGLTTPSGCKFPDAVPLLCKCPNSIAFRLRKRHNRSGAITPYTPPPSRQNRNVRPSRHSLWPPIRARLYAIARAACRQDSRNGTC